MDAHSNHSEDLNALERRLSTWQPASAGLNVDAMLFAAGRATVQPGPARFVWPALTALMTVLSVLLGLWLADERNERLTLASRLRERTPAPSATPPSWPAVIAASEELSQADELSADSYFASRRALEQGIDAWPNRVVFHNESPNPSFTNPPILRLGQRNTLLEP